MKVGGIYSLRMALLNAGHIPVPCWDGMPVMILRSPPTEGYVHHGPTLTRRLIRPALSSAIR